MGLDLFSLGWSPATFLPFLEVGAFGAKRRGLAMAGMYDGVVAVPRDPSMSPHALAAEDASVRRSWGFDPIAASYRSVGNVLGTPSPQSGASVRQDEAVRLSWLTSARLGC